MARRHVFTFARNPQSAREVENSPMIYLDFADWWIGYYRGDDHHYVCPLPTLVICWSRRHAR